MFTTSGGSGTVRSAASDFSATDLIEVVRALADVKLAALQIDVDPSQARATRMPRKPVKIAVSSIGRQRPVRRGDDGADLVRRRDVDADLELTLPLVGARYLAPPMRAQVAHDVLSDQPALLSIGQDRRRAYCAACAPSPASDPCVARPRTRAPSARDSCESFTAPISGTMCRATCC